MGMSIELADYSINILKNLNWIEICINQSHDESFKYSVELNSLIMLHISNATVSMNSFTKSCIAT